MIHGWMAGVKMEMEVEVETEVMKGAVMTLSIDDSTALHCTPLYCTAACKPCKTVECSAVE